MGNPLSHPVIGGMVGTLGALVIAGVGYYAYTSATFLKPDPLSRMRTTCEAALSSPDATRSLKGLTPAAACSCFADVFYPSLTEPSREYVRDLYERIEKNAPASSSARAAYDADFGERLKAAFQVDQFSHMGNAVQFVSEISALNRKDFGPQCNLLK